MSASVSSSVSAIRFVCLPCEVQTTYDVCQVSQDLLGIEEVTSVLILSKIADTGVAYRSAIIDIGKWSDSTIAKSAMDTLMNNPNGFCITPENTDYHFDNGKPMQHIKFTPATPHSPSSNPLELQAGDWDSLYIPFLPNDLSIDNGDVRYNDQASFAELFEDQMRIGKISRIDFVSKNVAGREIRSAYVHFDHWYDNSVSKNIRGIISNRSEFTCHGYYDGFEFRNFDMRRFMTFKVNHKPIPSVSTDLNVHQLASAKEALDKRVAELEELNAALVKELFMAKDTISYLRGEELSEVNQVK